MRRKCSCLRNWSTFSRGRRLLERWNEEKYLEVDLTPVAEIGQAVVDAACNVPGNETTRGTGDGD
jgi:hypothetical protein